ncbi:thioredoxin-disulfide reductase [Halothermothrix orenii]|uniref:Thioredoxin reductase n=1 Tax=Halothermothrix orenii (strain H 168 / OCM 544 / DSM 9562) TaxID=373903 RepID=B8CZT4_HALOH|nr:thioredoxin-disulfide reductase [Halothermothrix orenii]ACL70786.1 thioredoxin reductase [Halothermothrix orenii H 168]
MAGNNKEKMIIIGGGPAGLTAAIYAARAGLNPMVIVGPEPGGQITTTSEIENYPGFPEGITGFDLMQKVIEQAQKFDVRLQYEVVENVDFNNSPYNIKTDGGEYQADSIIIATGASPRKLGLEKEEDFIGKGISYCATCDGAFFKDQEVAVVGGGDVALEEANYLTNFCSKVYLIHRRDQFRGTKILGDRVKNNSKVEILWDTEVRELLGGNKVEGLLVENNKTGEETRLENVKALFIAVGYKPNTDLFKGQLEVDDRGYIITNDRLMTSKEGIFAAGDVQDPHYRQVVTSAASGAIAAMEAGKYLETIED